METPELTRREFWASNECCVMAPPGREAEGEEIGEAFEDQESVFFATSGSCGSPKWVMFQRRALLASAAAVNQHLEVSECDRFMLALPLYHVGGFGVVARSYAANCSVTTLEGGWNPRCFKEAVELDHSTLTSLVPTQVHDLVALGLKAPRSLRAIIVGGGKMNEEEGRLARELGWPVLQSYGMTEAGSQIATADLASLNEPFRAGPLPILPIWKCRTSAEGCLEFRGPALCECYIQRGRGEMFCRGASNKEGWFSSSDLVQLRGGQVTVNGRADRKVKILGELVDVEAMESEIKDCLSYENVCLLALPDSRRGTRLVLVIEEDFNRDPDLLKKVNRGKAGIFRIDEIRAVAQLPRTAMGKIDSGALRKQFGSSQNIQME